MNKGPQDREFKIARRKAAARYGQSWVSTKYARVATEAFEMGARFGRAYERNKPWKKRK